MYLFVFNWVPALQEAARPGTVLPLGYIFSAFMVSMMIGSLLYTSLVSLFARGEHEPLDAPASDAPLTLHAKLSSLVCAVSAVAFAVSVESADERVRFWAFCTFEACVGMYYPIQGMLRGSLISNEHRATVSLFSILFDFCVLSWPFGTAVVPVPRAAQHLCRRLPTHWRLLRPLHCPHCELAHARPLVADDSGLPRRAYRVLLAIGTSPSLICRLPPDSLSDLLTVQPLLDYTSVSCSPSGLSIGSVAPTVLFCLDGSSYSLNCVQCGLTYRIDLTVAFVF